MGSSIIIKVQVKAGPTDGRRIEFVPDGSLFLEGQGVQPTLRVPITAANVLASDDAVLQAAEAELAR